MRKFKKLIPALALLLVSLVLVSTASYAWFSMNTQVTATGMQVNTKSNSTFLLINKDDNDTAAEIQSAGVITVPLTVSDLEATVLPARPKYASEIGSGKRFETGTAVTSATTAATVGNWYTANNNNPASANDSVKNIHDLEASGTYQFDKYVIKKTVYLTLAVGSEHAHNLTVTPTITLKGESPTDITGVRVLVATGSNYAILDSTMSGVAQSLHATSDTTFTDSTVVTVDIYIYYDGEAAAVYTNNAANLAGANISLAFDVEVGDGV
jgi:hypothetical protein